MIYIRSAIFLASPPVRVCSRLFADKCKGEGRKAWFDTCEPESFVSGVNVTLHHWGGCFGAASEGRRTCECSSVQSFVLTRCSIPGQGIRSCCEKTDEAFPPPSPRDVAEPRQVECHTKLYRRFWHSAWSMKKKKCLVRPGQKVAHVVSYTLLV